MRRFRIVGADRRRALKSCPGASGVIVKLVRRDKAPALAFIISRSVCRSLGTTSLSAKVRTGKSEVTQDVFVRVKKKHDMDAIVEPLCPDPNVRPLGRGSCSVARGLSSAITLCLLARPLLSTHRSTSSCRHSG